MEGKKVNMDYICTIVENDGRTVFRTVDIPRSVELVSKLEGLRRNPNATVLDMQAHMEMAVPKEDRRLIDYISPYRYSSTFVYKTSYPRRRTWDSLQKELQGRKNTLEAQFAQNNKELKRENPGLFKAHMDSSVSREMDRYADKIKGDYLSDAKRFIQAYNYLRTVRTVKGWPDMRMYSTDTVGFSDFDYKVTEDVSIHLKTNFGYGCAAYFRLGLRYKGIDILPYSLMVRYYYANMRDLIRYTRVYSVDRDSWNTAFAFVEETANQASADASAFVEKWILNEVREMVAGLHSILEDPAFQVREMVEKCGQRAETDYLHVRNMLQDEKESYGVYPDEMTMAVQAEKVTGALDFLANLTTLSELLPEIEGFIAEIKEMATEVVPGMDSMLKSIRTRVDFLKERLKEQNAELEKLEKAMKPHEAAIDRLYKNRGEKFKLANRDDFRKKYAASHKAYADKYAAASELRGRIDKLEREARDREGFAGKLEKCRRKVSDAGLAESPENAA